MSEAQLSILDASDPDEFKQWLGIWQQWDKREVFAHPAYVKLFASSSARALCAIWQTKEGIAIIYPFLLRSLETEPYVQSISTPIADIITPYGYGGPFFLGQVNASVISTIHHFWAELDIWLREHGTVTEFVRFSLDNNLMNQYPGELVEIQKNVVCDLTLDTETIWMGFEHKVRKNVKKAQRSGVNIVVDTEGQYIDAFLRIYYDTMVRRSASERYLFPREFFDRIHIDLQGSYSYFHAYYNGEIVSTELVLISADNVYSFLGGTDSRFFELRPNDLLKHYVMLWAKEHGKRAFVLGGGYEPDDGIYKYKRAFAPTGIYSFQVGKRVLLPNIYQKLIMAREQIEPNWSPRADFFPRYRA